MTHDELVATRRQLLADEVERHGQANIARKTGKADRQIGDLIAGRVSFGDRLARQLEPLLRPDLPPGWLVFADQADAPLPPEPPSPEQTEDNEVEARAQALTQLAAEVAGLWVSLPDERRTEILLALRKEAGKAGDQGTMLTLKQRKRTARAPLQSTGGERI